MHSCLWPTWRAVFAVFSRTIYLVLNVHISNKATAAYRVMLSPHDSPAMYNGQCFRIIPYNCFANRLMYKQENDSLLLRLLAYAERFRILDIHFRSASR